MNRKILITSSVANSFEWYDYGLFGLLAPVIGRKFFPESDPAVQSLQAFLVFALGYLIRPMGGVVFGVIGDKFGRKIALSSSVICMAVPTALIGIIPTYETIGITATSLMIAIRILQGLSMGGALTGSVSFLIEHSPDNKKGLFGSIPMASICVGILTASIFISVIKYIVGEKIFDDWAWRIPFIFGMLIFFAGVYIRKHTQETPSFTKNKNSGKITNNPLKESLSTQWRQIIQSIFINAPGSILFYIEAIYLIDYLKTHRNISDNIIDLIFHASYILMGICCILSGWLSDKIGGKKIFATNIIVIIVSSPFIFYAFKFGNLFQIIAAQILLTIIVAFYIGPEPALQAELFPSRLRNTSLSLSYNTATSIFGGTTPYLAGWMVIEYGTITVIPYYIITISLISLVAVIMYKKSK